VTLADFCEKASHLARERSPHFPLLRPQGLVEVDINYADSICESDQRVKGVGWQLRVELYYAGPGDTVLVEEWLAVASGLGVRLSVEGGERDFRVVWGARAVGW